MELWLGENNAPIKNEGASIMNIIKYFCTIWGNFKANIRILGKFNLEHTLHDLQQTNTSILHDLNICKKNLIDLYYEFHQEEKVQVQDELDFIKECGQIETFPYPQIKKIQHNIVVDFDKRLQLPFVIHKDKRLYFAKEFTIESAKAAYINYVERENLLGGGYTAKAPHQYITDSFHVEQNDIVVDAGCAEALFALDSVEKAKHIYLLEADAIWHKPLQATFAPFKDKVTIIQKFLSGENFGNAVTLDGLFDKFSEESFFIKMDIEGAEESVIQGNKKFLTSQNKIKLACCTYHRAHHAEMLSSLLKDMGYIFEFSDGYMLFPWDEHQQPPYFRKGLIRAVRSI